MDRRDFSVSEERSKSKVLSQVDRYNIVGVVSAVPGGELVRGDKLSIYRARVCAQLSGGGESTGRKI